jgi:hypothetical protein
VTPPLSVEAAFALGAGPAAEIEARIASAGEAELEELRLAICAHPACGALAARFGARMRQLERESAESARGAEAAG